MNNTNNDFKDIERSIENDKIRKLISIMLWIVVIAWVSMVGYDYYRTTKKMRPRFCLLSQTISYDDGSVFECTGPGYKYYEYNRDSMQGSKIGGFWIKE